MEGDPLALLPEDGMSEALGRAQDAGRPHAAAGRGDMAGLDAGDLCPLVDPDALALDRPGQARPSGGQVRSDGGRQRLARPGVVELNTAALVPLGDRAAALGL